MSVWQSGWRAKAWGVAAAIALALAACGGGVEDDPNAPGAPTPGSRYAVTLLLSDVGLPDNPLAAPLRDASLINGWGIAIIPRALAWVTNNATSSGRLFDGDGSFSDGAVGVPPGLAGPARPTGVVANESPAITVTRNNVTARCIVLLVTEAGTLNCWAPDVVAQDTTAIVADDGASGAVYKGLALASSNSGLLLHATDFRNARVQSFNARFAKGTLLGTFADPTLPAGFAPFGIQEIDDLIYVSYAKQDASGRSEVAGAGLGLINVFDSEGRLLRRLVPAGGVLNVPWGMAMAPIDFGSFSGALLVSNAGDGKINAFHPVTGAWLGALTQPDDTAIVLDGLHGIAIGRALFGDPNAGDTPSLYFVAGPGGGAHGAYGRITVR